ncbi:cold shock domain-containing protein [Streptomyces sp. SL13]|uniref:Cold shock domain-containing protein n=1 Tax=Streptantibioticus silvisoli TaxID=2705255 RepID=A0AA90H528_9ACTN|nr:cold shock domain-containing protein [Streptantibioticus silvisoli]MDI5973659.1 cold shock domain-containing protein [Streptantibioticus silvisoli]
MVVTGRIVRFDDVRGYGFIAPDDGGEDVFVHANDLRDEKFRYRAGLRVGFEVEDGDRGLKASDVHLLEQPKKRADDEEILCDVLSYADFSLELTEAILDGVPTLSGAQIVQVRRRVMELVQTHNWVEG